MKISAATLLLCAAGVCAAQNPVATTTSEGTAPKHFRLTFVLTYPEGRPSQSFVLDVPLSGGRPGMANMSVTAGLSGQAEGSVQQSLQCTDVHESATGLAAKVTFTMDSVAAEPLPGSTEHLHNNLTFDRKIDVALAKPTRITEEMHAMPLKKGDEAAASSLPAVPQITVTAIEM